MKLLLGLLLISLSVNDNKRGLITTDEVVMLVVDDKMTKDELDSYKLILKKSFNIDIEYGQSTFNSKGKLKAIVLNIDCNDGSKGQFQSSKFDKDKKVGFYKTLKEGHSTSLFIGPLPDIKDIK